MSSERSKLKENVNGSKNTRMNVDAAVDDMEACVRLLVQILAF